MSSGRYVALLRGINVGGRNRVAMADLRRIFEAGGLDDVGTYIQSGNVLFTTDAPADTLEGSVEEMLAGELGLPVIVVVRSHTDLKEVVVGAPDGFGSEPDKYHYDAAFLKAPLTGEQAAGVMKPREGVDRVWPGPGVAYYERLSARRSQSRMSRITQTPEYALMTIRNWNTTTRLLEMLDERSG